MLAEFIASLIDPVETGEQIDARSAVIAQAINADYPPSKWTYGVPAWRGLVLRTWFEEGARFSLEVHAGRKRGDDGRAACLGQVWSHGTLLPRAQWLGTMGTDLHSTFACAGATSRYLALGVERCMRSNLSQLENTARIVMLYGTGSRCVPTLKDQKTPAYWAWDRAAGAMRWATVFEKASDDAG